MPWAMCAGKQARQAGRHGNIQPVVGGRGSRHQDRTPRFYLLRNLKLDIPWHLTICLCPRDSGIGSMIMNRSGTRSVDPESGLRSRLFEAWRW